VNHVSLFSGYDGIGLGLSLVVPTCRTVGYVEIEAFAAANLVAAMQAGALAPAPIWSDARTFDGRPWRGRVDIVSAGYPCQPFSLAGKRGGEDDPRHLWPEVRRIIGDIRPRLVFLENVPGHISLGFDSVLADLAALGFDAEWQTLSASEMGASHKRERLWVLAYAQSFGGREGRSERAPRLRGSTVGKRGGELADATGIDERKQINKTDTNRVGRKARKNPSSGGGSMADPRLGQLPQQGRAQENGNGPGSASAGVANLSSVQRQGIERREPDGVLPGFPPGPGERERWADIIERHPDLAPAVESAVHGMADGSTVRVDRLRSCGNGVVPIVAAAAFAKLARRFGLDFGNGGE